MEALVVLAVLGVAAAVAMPVLSQSRRSAHETATVQAAKQLGMALAIYRTEHDGDGRYGVASQMGLPVFGSSAFVSRFPFDPWWRTPCVPHGQESPAGFTYWPADHGGPTAYPPSVVATWVAETSAFEERTLVASTLNCTPTGWDVQNQCHPKLGIGVDLGVQLRRVRKSGHPARMRWWQD